MLEKALKVGEFLHRAHELLQIFQPARGVTLAGAAMWVFVNLRIWPNLRIVLGQVPADPAAIAVARETVRFYARLNLVLALPVTFVMVAAAHLY